MILFREQHKLLISLLAICGLASICIDFGSPIRIALCLVLLVSGYFVYTECERAGLISNLYPSAPKSIATPEAAAGVRRAGAAVFLIMAAYFSAFILLTGGVVSPLFFLIYLPIIHVSIRHRVVVTVALSMVSALAYLGVLAVSGAASISHLVLALSFPIAGLFGSIVRVRLTNGVTMLAKKFDELDSLMDVSRMLETAVNLETSLSLVLINTQRIIPCDSCAIYLLDADRTTLRLSSFLGPKTSKPFLPVTRMEQLECVGWNIPSGDVQIMQRASWATAVTVKSVWLEETCENAMVAALTGSEGVIGFLYVGRKHFEHIFTKAEASRLHMLTGHVGMALQKAKYQDELEKLAYTDSMTGLANYRYFERRLSEEIAKCKRYKHPLSVILIDIDHFKEFNDRYGHQAGDDILQKFGGILQDCLRETDLAARYGGEEFIIVCPTLSEDDAGAVAERIRVTMEAQQFELNRTLMGSITASQITVSLGVASYSPVPSTTYDIVTMADKALYQAKKNGRNRCVNASSIGHTVEYSKGSYEAVR